MRLTLPDDAATAAFSEAIRKLSGDDHCKILLAVSGGPDSVAMLLLATSVMPDRICAATVDHQLRPEAADEAAFVGRICIELGIPHKILRPASPIVGNIQSEARTTRYALLREHMQATQSRWLATAHHADDQLETLLMRLSRGSGIDGLAAIRARNGPVIRPMLGFSKVELEALCAAAGVIPVQDPSNEDSDFDRVAIRKWLASSKHPFDAKRAVRTATALSEATDALNWMTDRFFSSHVKLDGESATIQPADLPDALRRRLLLATLAQLEPGVERRGDAIDRALTDLSAGKRFTLGNLLCEGGVEWTVRPAPPRRQ